MKTCCGFVKNIECFPCVALGKGNTVIIIEHNLDVIKLADTIIDIGPEGGRGGGNVLIAATPEEVAKSKKGYTYKYLSLHNA